MQGSVIALLLAACAYTVMGTPECTSNADCATLYPGVNGLPYCKAGACTCNSGTTDCGYNANPTESRGQCTSGICVCTLAFQGWNCQYDVCATKLSECTTPNGNCEANTENTKMVCDCEENFVGNTCQTKICGTDGIGEVCENGGTCNVVDGGGKGPWRKRVAAGHTLWSCTCPDTHTGYKCQEPKCKVGMCGTGTCSPNAGSDAGHTCTCDTDFHGDECQIPNCADGACNTAGDAANACTATGTSVVGGTPGYSCSCVFPWFGGNCDKNYCTDPAGGLCGGAGGGTCIEVGSYAKCQSADFTSTPCNDGWTGGLCTIDLCTPNPCKNGGVCAGTVAGTMFAAPNDSVPNYPGYTCDCTGTNHIGGHCETATPA